MKIEVFLPHLNMFGKWQKVKKMMRGPIMRVGGEKGRRPTPEQLESMRQKREANIKAGKIKEKDFLPFLK